jgi:hypothetical protein
MNKLLKFFIPKITKEILKFFVILVGALVIIRFMPINDDGKTFFTFLLLFVGFPMITYFNKVMYLPASIDWILLTPIKKTHIVLVHGFINIFKIVILLILINIVFLIIYKKFLMESIFNFLQTLNAEETFTRIPVEAFVSIVGIIGLALIFIFGILPNYIQTMQQKQNYQVKRTPKENFTIYLTGGICLLLGALFISDDILFFPWLLKISLLFVFFALIAINSTIKSLRFYYSKKILSLFGVGLFLFSSLTLYFYAKNDLSSPNLHVMNKIESLKFLGSFSSHLDQEIEKDLIASEPSLALMSSRDLEHFFMGANRNDMALRVLEKWDQVCREKVNFICRFAYYMRSNAKGMSNSLEMVKKACPNDLGSCLIVYTTFDSEVSKEEMIQNAQQAQVILTARCKDNKNNFENRTCLNFNREMKYKQNRK